MKSVSNLSIQEWDSIEKAIRKIILFHETQCPTLVYLAERLPYSLRFLKAYVEANDNLNLNVALLCNLGIVDLSLPDMSVQYIGDDLQITKKS